MKTRYKTVKVSLVHYQELSKMGETKDTFDKVIGRLLEDNKVRSDGGSKS
jgi:predicted CopG family antitoxin